MILNFQVDFWEATELGEHGIPGTESRLYDVSKC